VEASLFHVTRSHPQGLVADGFGRTMPVDKRV
jgi:hypothetical protein